MDKEEVIKKVQKYILLLKNHFNIEQVFLFGSYAKNNYHEDSDIDVAIVVEEVKGDYFETTPILWRLRREVDDRIEPILIERKHDESGFLSEIRKSGIEIN
ncbi:MAG: nucleotidyltransferase domain-containing protein [Bacteroidales bacterium]|nr:nucleotidyltransferase domain-containing protein [Bacteroidales bacterium]MCF8343275.1 nucleotidyltransferase domain-containing protein [Bacteroidales bacterium]MCF8350847.1 nucleotidyltransferase domain-containing protein [Bacteroidales bacterium]MCF8375744.1 nucleotidyltransferase domain-containing protein [Bacteroidales bacterium]MCF8400344.1 nucleotidyltransferase domain-containing protein [Bacteroidales bacterium]